MSGKSESEQKNHRKNIKTEFQAFQRAVIDKVDEIQTHINVGSGTTDFALMFIPTEAIYYAVVSDKNGINEENLITWKGGKIQLLDAMLEQRVIPVSPSTFYPFIQVILTGIRNMKVAENLETLQKRLTSFETKMRTFTSAYEKIGESLNEAKSQWEITGNRFDDLITLGGRITNALNDVELKDTLLDDPVNSEMNREDK